MVLLDNARARFEYEISETLVAGVVLSGGEVKSLRGKHGSLTGSFVKVIDSEVWMINVQISPYPFANNTDYEPKRSRKLLLKRHEILKLQTDSLQKGRIMVPLRIEAVGHFIKVIIGVGRGKSTVDKRATVRKREQSRELDRFVKSQR
ncbi:SsrA-binding protein SmpB [Candidatus Woesebacteria bacterium]|nr:SsrA-binding protein SmpB [Candidatus Woesebacteria bacterium]